MGTLAFQVALTAEAGSPTSLRCAGHTRAEEPLPDAEVTRIGAWKESRNSPARSCCQAVAEDGEPEALPSEIPDMDEDEEAAIACFFLKAFEGAGVNFVCNFW